MNLLVKLFVFLLFIFAISFAVTPTYAAPPSNFQSSQIIGSGLNTPTGFDIAPDGRIFILQQSGAVKIYKNGQLLSQPFVTLPASQAGGDLGALGIAFDPDFHINHYVYFYYTSNDSKNTIVRYDASGDTAGGSEFFVYESPVAQDYHAGGTIAFGPDKKLYFSNGDNIYPPNSQDLSNPLGKILRINKDGSIPSDNPFVGQSGKLPEIWAYGLRNPFRFQFDSGNGRLYLGDVGEKAWEEVNVITKGSNYGWPICEGSCSTSGMTNPIHSYDHNAPSSSVTGGLVYRGTVFPSSYQGDYFFADYSRGFIKTLNLDSSGNSTGVSDFDTSAGAVVDLKQASDGSIYYLTIFPGRLYKITYNSSNQVPTAKSSADKTSGQEPLTINFSSIGSSDPEGTPLTYSWDFGDGTTSTQANPSKTYTNAGTYTVNLTVSDGTHQSQAIPIVIQSGIPPTLQITTPANNSTYKAGDTISYSASATDRSGQSLPESAFTTEIIFHHSTHQHPFLGPFENKKSGNFIVPQTGENSTDVWYEIKVTAKDSNGLETTSSSRINPIKVNLTFLTNPGNQKVYVDSQLLQTPVTIESVAGFNREVNVPQMQLINGTYYQFDSWSNGGAQKHFLTTPTSASTFTANLKSTPAFSASYYNNINLSGSPVLTRNEGMIDYDYGDSSPHSSVNNDNFSTRWVKQHYFKAGNYRFDTLSDDGIRLFIDGNNIIDKWIDQGSTPYSATISLTEGNHEIKFEYFDHGGGANVKLNWDLVNGQGAPLPSGQSVTSFTLINADSNQPISSFDPIPAGSNINLGTLPTKNLNIRANTNPATVGSVKFGFDSNQNFGTETNAPYALASDDGGDYNSWTPTVGSHSIIATPYSSAGGAGTAGTPLTLNFTVTDQGTTPSGQSVTSFTLINADSNQPISEFNPIPTGATININNLPTKNLNIRANTNPATVGSVKFGLDGNSNYGTETNAPYALASDENGDYLSWTPSTGSHTVTATPYSAAGGTGTVGTPLSVTFTITDQGSNPTPTPTPTPNPSGQSVSSFSLINADNDQVISGYDSISNGSTISLNSLPTRNLNLRANTNPGTVGSVRFGLDGNSNYGTETNAPYALASDEGGNYFGWTPSIGSHTVTATPYSAAGAGGTVGTPLSIQFNIAN